MVIDEVQAGLSRTGSPVAHQHAFFRGPAGDLGSIGADIMTMAKPLAGGLPIGAVLLKQKVADCLMRQTLTHRGKQAVARQGTLSRT